MGSLSLWHWVIIIAVVLLLFGGKGKVSDLMGDVAKGIKSFKKGMADGDDTESDKTLEATVEEVAPKAAAKAKAKS
ncbi:twin-arginine translocase TatA/TatE family subunit [Aestuariivirga litoralis]|uniref:twin-arginine translocase TatA/TatE family subunit n=1 Tax=Aestuariivirga litoralis TaxID=2650924 RepID=UPI0018C5EE7A|nr:twin-arginine translocase TatA/TatE family subunit [Aestuariivirga litoralis]MBG1231366.1 twin-arginine translocase TatA/TatE family subunit [Aestuariivirga litoralis]